MQKKKSESIMTQQHNLEDVLTFFYMIGYGQYVDTLRPHFEEYQVCETESLKCLDIHDLHRFGVKKLLHAKDIIAKIQNI